MTNLKDIRNRIRSTESVKQITKAMEMVSAARLRRVQGRVKAAHHYVESLEKMLKPLASDEIRHPLLEIRKEVKKVGVVIVAGEKGLCGSFNVNIIDEANEFLKQYHPDQIELILVGVKVIEYFQKTKWTIRSKLEFPLSKMPYSQMKTFGQEVVEDFLRRNLDEVWFIYTKYISNSSRVVKREKFLNIDKNQFKTHEHVDNYIYEPGPEAIVERLLPLYSDSRVHSMLLESYAAELAARVEAMRMATTNASDMIERLTMIRNKVRQASVTKEILEIALGAEGVH